MLFYFSQIPENLSFGCKKLWKVDISQRIVKYSPEHLYQFYLLPNINKWSLKRNQKVTHLSVSLKYSNTIPKVIYRKHYLKRFIMQGWEIYQTVRSLDSVGLFFCWIFVNDFYLITSVTISFFLVSKLDFP